MRRSNKGTALLLAILVATVTQVSEQSTAQAEGSVGVHGGFRFVDELGFFGLQSHLVIAKLGGLSKVVINPNLDIGVFDETVIFVATDFNLLFPFDLKTFFSPYAAAGFGVTYVDYNPGERTDFDFNLLAGLSFNTGTLVEPFAEAEASMFGTDTITIRGGVRFVWGREEPVVPGEAPPEEHQLEWHGPEPIE